MYEYYNGYIIREGTEGISGAELSTLYENVGWASSGMPEWQKEKYELALRNSAWAFTVWHGEELVGMIRVVSDKVMVASIQDMIIKDKHRGQGLGKKLIQLCLQKLPHGNWSARTTPENFRYYSSYGFELEKQEEEATMFYNGFGKARRDGHR